MIRIPKAEIPKARLTSLPRRSEAGFRFTNSCLASKTRQVQFAICDRKADYPELISRPSQIPGLAAHFLEHRLTSDRHLYDYPTCRYPQLVTLTLRAETGVSQGGARASNPLDGWHGGCKASDDLGFYEREIGFLPSKGGMAGPVCPALQLSVPVGAGPYRLTEHRRFRPWATN